MTETPYHLSLIVCDGLHRDQGSGKLYLMGLFETVSAVQFPTVHPLLAVYVSLTNGRGKMPIKVMLVGTQEDEAVFFSNETEVEFLDPRAILELPMAITGVSFPTPGEYRLQVYANSEFVVERRIVVAQVGGRANEDANKSR